MYRALDPALIIRTIDRLARRIEERFPEAGLLQVCQELGQVARETHQRCRAIARPNWTLRIGVLTLVAAAFAALLYSLSMMDLSWGHIDAAELVTVSEAAMNDLVLIGAAIFFLVTSETRVKRRRAQEALDEVRAIAHVIDMHQLTKDPSTVVWGASRTASSPQRPLTPFELARYLDYCSEMMAPTGKVAALYAQSFPDEVVLAGVNDIETLCTGIGRKIWQKIMILDQLQIEASDP